VQSLILKGHTYVLTSNKPSTATVSMAFKVLDIAADGAVSIEFGVFSYSVTSRRSDTVISVASLYTGLKRSGECRLVQKTATCN
jgi:hypothetical protein